MRQAWEGVAAMREIPKGQLCQAKDEYGIVPDTTGGSMWGVASRGCSHPATVRWGDLHDFNHGGGKFWCECCALDAQIAHAEERVKALDELRAKRITACQ
jgi:hypothetical protein